MNSLDCSALEVPCISITSTSDVFLNGASQDIVISGSIPCVAVGVSGSSSITIQSFSLFGSSIQIGSNNNDITVSSMTIIKSPTTYGISTTDTSTEGISITLNKFQSCASYCAYLQGTGTITFSNNTIELATTSVLYIDAVAEISVLGNSILNSNIQQGTGDLLTLSAQSGSVSSNIIRGGTTATVMSVYWSSGPGSVTGNLVSCVCTFPPPFFFLFFLFFFSFSSFSSYCFFVLFLFFLLSFLLIFLFLHNCFVWFGFC
jgi:hypothetical protein